MLQSLTGLWPLALLVLALSVIALILKLLIPAKAAGKPAALESEPLPYARVDSLLSKGELAFYRTLVSAVAARSVVMTKVRLADLITVTAAGGAYMRAFNKLSAKHADFVLCDPDTLRPRLVIELDDRSHRRPARQDRDVFVDSALAAAGLPLLRIPAAASYAATDVERRIATALRPPG